MTKKTIAVTLSVLLIAGGGYYYSRSKSVPSSSVRVTEKDTVAAFT